MQLRQSGLTQEASAAKSGVSIRTGRRLERHGQSVKAERTWQTRKDPLAAVWESVLVPLLAKEPTLTGLTLWEYLDEHHAGQYPYSLLRTLQRRVKHWRATKGPDRPVMFRQTLPPGLQGLSDFTHPGSAVTIQGQAFTHLIYQFRLAFSGWRFAHVVQGGESYSALAEGLQNALHTLGGVPLEHRIEQALTLRGSSDFDSIADYQLFIDRCVDRLNRYTVTKVQQEVAVLNPLPRDRFMDYSELSVKVTSSCSITVKRGLYTVPSRLIGETLRIHLHHDKLIGFVGQSQVLTLLRVYPSTPEGRARQIDYRHVIHPLAAKPQAFRFSNFRDIYHNHCYCSQFLL